MDGRILEMFMKENDAWDDLTARQSKELPQLENMLASIFKRNNLDEEIMANASLLKEEMQLQETQMLEIREHPAKHQNLLAIEQRSASYPTHSLLSQNAL
jgi:ABC-type histidine transport system ATPase subunit